MNLNPIAAALQALGFELAVATPFGPSFGLFVLIINDFVVLSELILTFGLQPIEIHTGGGGYR